MAERRGHHWVWVRATAILTGALAHTAAAQDQPTPPILMNVHASWNGAAVTRGYLDYFRGIDPQPDYEQREEAAIGIGGALGFRPLSFAELHLGVDIVPRRVVRSGARVDQTETITSAELRFNPPRPGAANRPYFGIGVSSIYATERDTPTRPWPNTSAMWGTGSMLFGGVQRRVGAHTALDIGVALSVEHVSRLQLAGVVEKDPHTGTTVVPRVRFGLSRLPSVTTSRMADTLTSPIAVGRMVRLHGPRDVTYSGTVLAVNADTVLLQSENSRKLRQVAVPLRCVTSIDLHVGNENPVHSVISSAVEGLVAVSAAALVARYAGEARIPTEPRRFARRIALPGAALGGAVGLLRNRYRWAPAPLPAGAGNGARTGC